MTDSKKIKAPDNKSENTEKKDNTDKKKNRVKIFLLAFSLLFAAIIYIIFLYKESWLGAINRIDIFSSSNIDIKKIENNLIEQDLISQKIDKTINIKNQDDNSLTYQKEETLIRFSPDEEDLDMLNDQVKLNPYECEIKEKTENNKQIFSDIDMINNLNDYRVYLANIHEFLYKFSKNQPYSKNLDIITKIQLPQEFTEIIEMSKLYNEMLIKNNRSYEEIPLFGTNIFNKFLKISKKTSDCKKMNVLKSQVEEKIKPFAEYVFSPVLQAEFFE